MICAGRKPGAAELEEIRHAGAVILPQGCSEDLYYMARENCKNVFPDYDARFKYPGKTGQILLFQKTETAHPAARIFSTLSSLYDKDGNIINENLPFIYPFVLKFNWGGEGETVYLIKTLAGLKKALKKAGEFERTGQKGFILQEYIESGNRSLRIAVIGQKFISYWRVQKDHDSFCAGLSKGAIMDFDSDKRLIRIAEERVRDFCGKAGINLAGFDLIFSSEKDNDELVKSHNSDGKVKSSSSRRRESSVMRRTCRTPQSQRDEAQRRNRTFYEAVNNDEPLFLEINYFFGRKGLGGSEKFYKILNGEIVKWLKSLDLKKKRRN
ncbi:MAG: hypothetical protein Q8M56_05380 [Desulfobacterales bacterium]|nr:hypothetical protein [Desulfobacterales bacterium]